jgi:hypothetical protein
MAMLISASGCSFMLPRHRASAHDRAEVREALDAADASTMVVKPGVAKPEPRRIAFAIDTSSWGEPRPRNEAPVSDDSEGDAGDNTDDTSDKPADAPMPKPPSGTAIAADTPSATASLSRLGEKYPVIYRLKNGRFAGFSVVDARGASEGTYYFDAKGNLVGTLTPSRKGNAFPATFTNVFGATVGFAEVDKRGSAFGWRIKDAMGTTIGHATPDPKGASVAIHFTGLHPVLDFAAE